MRSYDQFISEYAKSHRNVTNQIIHMICVPAIFFASVGLLWCVNLPAQRIPGLVDIPQHLLSWANLATASFIPILLFYSRLGIKSVVTGVIWSVISALGCVWIESAGLPLLWVSAAIWVTAWVVQFYGHYVEGAKPSFGDDIVFLLIGPLFVQKKFSTLLHTGSLKAMFQ